ncbi:MAG: YdcH family protein [Asticcacaulis sp.]|uniref:YdcH family protein n=1 Tax=Asticcacaulis sp. TaxID=1872648 RepID=UPI003F7BFB2B
MHDDTHIRSLRGKDGLHVVEGDKLDADVERRVAERTDAEFARLELVPPAQVKPLDEHRVRELPINADTVKLRNELALLKQEHKDLDDSISALEIVPLPDQILIARLKRKKLSLRDQITKIEDKIRPDIIA